MRASPMEAGSGHLKKTGRSPISGCGVMVGVRASGVELGKSVSGIAVVVSATGGMVEQDCKNIQRIMIKCFFLLMKSHLRNYSNQTINEVVLTKIIHVAQSMQFLSNQQLFLSRHLNLNHRDHPV